MAGKRRVGFLNAPLNIKIKPSILEKKKVRRKGFLFPLTEREIRKQEKS